MQEPGLRSLHANFSLRQTTQVSLKKEKKKKNKKEQREETSSLERLNVKRMVKRRLAARRDGRKEEIRNEEGWAQRGWGKKRCRGKKKKRRKERKKRKGRRRKLRGSNHRRILWDHNSGCCWYRAVEVLKDSFHPPVLIRSPSGDPRRFTADSAARDRNCFAEGVHPRHLPSSRFESFAVSDSSRSRPDSAPIRESKFSRPVSDYL